jgi:hypothetical protein
MMIAGGAEIIAGFLWHSRRESADGLWRFGYG